ncbi:MAG: acetyl-CoA carboxylase biotin carboxyl carrier protein [Candidatus Eremiobacterales bacterium]|jgi:oxaloacetate decarboxylase alpha subunit
MELDAKVLRAIVDVMQRFGLDRVRIRRDGVDVDARMSARSAPLAAQPGPAASKARAASRVPEAPANVRKVLAPLVGVFYRSPAPGAKPFVAVGDSVTGGQVLCILEAMKLMNEIVSEFDGTIAKICVEDGALVSLGQELFWIEA